MDLKEIAEAYQLVYEKKKLDPVGKEDDDVDNDGDVDSSDEYLKKRRAAIGKAMGKDDDKKDDDKEEDDGDSKGLSKGQKKLPPQLQKAIAKKGKKSDKKESLDLMSAYYSMYEHHQKDADGNVIPHEDEEEVKEGIDLSFVDELSEEELDILVEEVVYDLLDEGIELDAVEGAFTEYLEEAKITFGSDTAGEDEEVGTKTRSEKNPTPQEKMNAKLKKRKEEKAKASAAKAEKFKKSVGKAVTKVKAKMHGGMADYAGKRGLMPTKSAQTAKAPTKPTRPNVRNKKYQGSGGSDKLQTAKGKYAKDIKQYKEVDMPKYEKTKAKKQTSGQLKVSMLGGGAKDTRSKLRSAVFKDVKDRVGKKVKAVADAPKKAVEGIKKAGSSVKKGIKGMVNKAARKSIDTLSALEKRTAVKAEGLDMFDTVTAYLIDEGFAKDFDHAQRIMVTLDSALIEEVHAEQLQILEAYGKATPESGTGKYYNEKKPTAMQLAKRETLNQVKDLTNKGKHQEASDKYKSLTDEYLKVYEEKSTGDKLKDIAKKKQAKYDAQPQAYKNNPAFGDESHHSNAKNK